MKDRKAKGREGKGREDRVRQDKAREVGKEKGRATCANASLSIHYLIHPSTHKKEPNKILLSVHSSQRREGKKKTSQRHGRSTESGTSTRTCNRKH